MPKATTKRKGLTRSKLLDELSDDPKQLDPEPPKPKPASAKKPKAKRVKKKVTLSTPPDKRSEKKEPNAPKKRRQTARNKDDGEAESHTYVSTQDSYRQFLEQSRVNKERRRLRDVRRGLFAHYDSPLVISEPEVETIVKCHRCSRLINKADTPDHDKICTAPREQSMITVSRFVGSEAGESDEGALDYEKHIRKVYHAFAKKSAHDVDAIIDHYRPLLAQLLRATVEKYGTLRDTPGCFDTDSQARLCSFAAEKDLSASEVGYIMNEYPEAPERGFLELEHVHGPSEVPLAVFDCDNHNSLVGKVRVILAELCPERLDEAQKIADDCEGYPDQYLRMVYEELDHVYAPTPSQQEDRLLRLTKLYKVAAPELVGEAEAHLKAYEQNFEAYLYKLHMDLLR